MRQYGSPVAAQIVLLCGFTRRFNNVGSSNNMDNLMLIHAVKERRILWDTTMRICDRKEYFNDLWQEVASVLNVTDELARKRWKSLRDSYRHEIRKIQRKLITESKWMHFSSLEFLRCIFDPKGLVPFPPFESNISMIDHTPFRISSTTRDLEDKSHDDDLIMLDDDDDDEDPEFIIIGDENSTQNEIGQPEEDCTPSLSPGKKRRRSSNRDVISVQFSPTPPPPVEDRLTSPLNLHNRTSLTTGINKEDSDYNFLISMMPHMKSLSDVGNLQFRMEVTRILLNIKRSEQNTQRENSRAVSLQNAVYNNLNSTNRLQSEDSGLRSDDGDLNQDTYVVKIEDA